MTDIDIVQVCGLILWGIFYGSYLAKVMLERKKGITVSRMCVGEKEISARVIEVFLLFFTYGTAAVQLLSVFVYHKWERLPAGNESVDAAAGMHFAGAFNLAGMVLAVAGIVFFISAMKEMKENWRAGIDENQNTCMVTGGIYKISRNPAFVGFDLFYAGYGILFSNGLMLLFAVLAIFTLHMQIKEEEKYMEKRYGRAYRAYKEKVRRYL